MKSIKLTSKKSGEVEFFYMEGKVHFAFGPIKENDSTTVFIDADSIKVQSTFSDNFFKNDTLTNEKGNYVENSGASWKARMKGGEELLNIFGQSYKYIDFTPGGYSPSLDGCYFLISINNHTYLCSIGVFYPSAQGLDGVRYENVCTVSINRPAVFDRWISTIKPDDDYRGPTSGTGGGKGTFDKTSDPVDYPPVPQISAVDTGFVTLYSPTLAQVKEVSDILWSDVFDIQNVKKIFADPADAIVGLAIVPLETAGVGTKEVSIGGIPLGITLPVAKNQFFTVDCGEFDCEEYFGSCFDYAPFTKFSIYLPYIGERRLNTDDIMHRKIGIRYNIDVLTGTCVAFIKCGESVLYEFGGQCATPIPINSTDYSTFITAALQLATTGIAAAAGYASTSGVLASTANMVMSAKPEVNKSGAVSGSAGLLGVQYPYLIWESPRQSLPVNYSRYSGYPSNITSTLSKLNGFTKIETIRLENVPCTKTEKEMIERMLKEGVIL